MEKSTYQNKAKQIIQNFNFDLEEKLQKQSNGAQTRIVLFEKHEPIKMILRNLVRISRKYPGK
jgi:hypothetical protein